MGRRSPPKTTTIYVGLEWEPQLSLHAFPGKQIFVEVVRRRDSPVSAVCATCHRSRCVVQTHPNAMVWIGGERWYRRLRGGGSNLEIRTKPVQVRYIAREIADANNWLATVIRMVARYVGPVGVLFPTDPLTKHLNLSPVVAHATGRPYNRCEREFRDDLYHVDNRRAVDKFINSLGVIGVKYGVNEACKIHSHRLHMRIPYRCPPSVYLEWLNRPLTIRNAITAMTMIRQTCATIPKKPLLLGYSMTGAKYIQRLALF